MRKHIVFLVGFILLSSLFILSIQVLSGIFLTSIYTPDIGDAWKESATLPQEIEVFSSGRSFLFTILSVTLSAIVAYFISDKFTKRVYKEVL